MISTILASAVAFNLVLPSGTAEVYRCPLVHQIQNCVDSHEVVKHPTMNLLLGHDNQFMGNIKKLRAGDTFAYARTKYVVTSRRVVSKNAVYMLERKADLIMYSCWGRNGKDGTPEKRIMIFADKL